MVVVFVFAEGMTSSARLSSAMRKCNQYKSSPGWRSDFGRALLLVDETHTSGV